MAGRTRLQRGSLSLVSPRLSPGVTSELGANCREPCVWQERERETRRELMLPPFLPAPRAGGRNTRPRWAALPGDSRRPPQGPLRGPRSCHFSLAPSTRREFHTLSSRPRPPAPLLVSCRCFVPPEKLETIREELARAPRTNPRARAALPTRPVILLRLTVCGPAGGDPWTRGLCVPPPGPCIARLPSA